MSTTEIRGELVELGWNAEMDSNRALVRCTLGALEALERNLTLQGPASVAIIAAAELDALRDERATARVLLSKLRQKTLLVCRSSGGGSSWEPSQLTREIDSFAKQTKPNDTAKEGK